MTAASPGPVSVKICGLREAADLRACAEAGVDLVGLVFFPPSPRYLSPDQAARLAASRPAGGPLLTGLLVDASDETIGDILRQVPLDLLQLQGAESPARVAEIRARFGLPVMKALGIAEAADLAQIDAYAPVADRLLLDAKPPAGATLPGGNAVSFDWRLLRGRHIGRPWLLAGGLTAENVAEALRLSGAPGVDVSSGVERRRGEKDAGLIRAFAAAAGKKERSFL